MRRRCQSWWLLRAVLVGLLALAGCGDDPQPPVTRGELPPLLAQAVPRLKQSGFEVQAMALGPKAIPVLAVDADEPILFAVAPKEVDKLWLPHRVSAFGEDFTPSVELFCGGFVVAGPEGVARSPVLNASGICRPSTDGGPS